MSEYIKRSIEPKILEAAKQFPVLAVTGPRQSGKSTMLRQIFPKRHYVTFDDMEIRKRAQEDPALFINSFEVPVIIDEVQYVPEILPYIKINVDNYRTQMKSEEVNGKFILTGSQVFNVMHGLTETLAGRIAIFELLPFSFEELGFKPHDPRDLYKQLRKGFYPVPNTQEVNFFYGSYLSTYIERDVRKVQNIKDISQFQSFMKVLAGRAANILNVQEISKELGIAHATAKNWLSILESSRIVYLLRPYFRNVSKRVVKSPKLYFVDSGLMAYLLGYQTEATLLNGPASGAIFENMIVVETLKKIFNHQSSEEMYFYRDSNGMEADLVINDKERFSLYEIKANLALQNKAAKQLMKIPLEPVDERAVLSMRKDKIMLSQDVAQKPWWDFVP